MLKNENFEIEAHAMGTNIEGNIEEILKIILDINKKFKESNIKRVLTTIKIDYRIDKESKIKNKRRYYDIKNS
jgi:uncharacterized protein YqgV (UPF0045/DUF77 family)